MIPGDLLLRLCTEEAQALLLASAFIKGSALKRVLGSVQASVDVTCIARCRPDDFIAGVSDLEMWDIVSARPRTTLLICPPLHAKFYRGSSRSLNGSANITHSGLGWSQDPNLELLVECDPRDPLVQAFEGDLLDLSFPATNDDFRRLREMMESLPLQRPPEMDAVDTELVRKWLPQLRDPTALFPAYANTLELLTTTSIEAALSDLQFLKLPRGMPLSAFNLAIGASLLQQPIVRRVDNFLASPRRFGEVSQFLGRYVEESDEAWQTLMRWLRHFLPERYEYSQPNVTEILWRKGNG